MWSSGKLLKEEVIPAVMLPKMPMMMSKVLLRPQGEGGGGGGKKKKKMAPYSREKQRLRIQSMATHNPSFSKSISKQTLKHSSILPDY